MGDPYEWEVVQEANDLTPYSTLAYGNGIWLRYDGGSWYRASDASFSDEQEITPRSPVAWLTDAEWGAALLEGTFAIGGARFSHDRFWTGIYGPWTYGYDENGELIRGEGGLSREEQLAYVDNRDLMGARPYYSFDFVDWYPAMEAGVTGFERGITNNTDSDIVFSESNGGYPLYHAASGRWFYADKNLVISDDSSRIFIVSTDDFSQPWEAIAVVGPGDDDPINTATPFTAYRSISMPAVLNGSEIVFRYELYEVGNDPAVISRWIAFGPSPTATGWDTTAVSYTTPEPSGVSLWPDFPSGVSDYSKSVWLGGGEWLLRAYNNSTDEMRCFYNSHQRASGTWVEVEIPVESPYINFFNEGEAFTRQELLFQDGMWAIPVQSGEVLNDPPYFKEDFAGFLVGPSLAHLELVEADLPSLPANQNRYYEFWFAGGGEWLVYVEDYQDTYPYDTEFPLRLVGTTEGGGWGIALA